MLIVTKFVKYGAVFLFSLFIIIYKSIYIYEAPFTVLFYFTCTFQPAIY